MALLHAMGFDCWREDEKPYMWASWFQDSPIYCYTTSRGRTKSDYSSGQCASLSLGSSGAYWVGRYLPKRVFTVIMGVALQSENHLDGGWKGVQFANENGIQCTFKMNIDGSVSMNRDASNVLQTSKPGIMIGEKWRHFEIKLHIDNTSGEFEVRCDGETVLSGENMDTQVRAGGITQIYFGHHDNTWMYFDDFYILDESGSYNKDFIGHPEVKTTFVVASGEHSEWLPSSGENYECVDDAYYLQAADYVQASGEDKIDTYNFTQETMEGGDSIEVQGVSILSGQYNDMSGMQTINHVMRISSTDYSGELHYLAMDDCYRETIVERNPSDDSAWTDAVVNSTEFGVKRNSNT